jgi:hypothetical protein
MRRCLLEANSNDPEALDQSDLRCRRATELVALALFWSPGLELVGAAGLGLVLLGALATLIRQREGGSHIALTAHAAPGDGAVVPVNGRMTWDENERRPDAAPSAS